MPDTMLHIRTAYHPARFFISSPPVWAGICRTARQGCLIPYSPLSRCNILLFGKLNDAFSVTLNVAILC